MLYQEPPFALGTTLKGKDADSNLINADKLGMIFEFPVKDVSGDIRGQKSRKTGRSIRAICLRNESGITLLPKRLVQLTVTAGYYLHQSSDGYATTLGRANIALVDPYLSSTNGVPDDDIFWGIIGGPALVLVPMAGADMNGDITVGSWLCASTGTTTGATTSGRVSNVTFTNATAGNSSNGFDGWRMSVYAVGRALSARTTQETTAGTDILVDFAIRL